jgi:sec-independent protein translocase protein TatB
MFGISGGEFLTLAFVALILIGPNKLPEFAVQSAKFIRKLRDFAQGMVNELKENLGPEYSDLEVTDLHPKKFIKRHLDTALTETTEIKNEINGELKKIEKNAKIDPDLL